MNYILYVVSIVSYFSSLMMHFCSYLYCQCVVIFDKYSGCICHICFAYSLLHFNDAKSSAILSEIYSAIFEEKLQ